MNKKYINFIKKKCLEVVQSQTAFIKTFLTFALHQMELFPFSNSPMLADNLRNVWKLRFSFLINCE